MFLISMRFQDYLNNKDFQLIKSNDYIKVNDFIKGKFLNLKLKFLVKFFPKSKLVEKDLEHFRELFKIAIIYDYENSIRAFLNSKLLMDFIYDRKLFSDLLILAVKNKLPTSLEFFNLYKNKPNINYSNKLMKIDYRQKQVFSYKKLCNEEEYINIYDHIGSNLDIHVFSPIVDNLRYFRTRARWFEVEAVTNIITECLSAKNFQIFDSLVSDSALWNSISLSSKLLPIKRYIEDDVAFDPEIIFRLIKVLDIKEIPEDYLIEVYKKLIIDEYFEEYKEYLVLVDSLPNLKEKIKNTALGISLDDIREPARAVFLDFVLSIKPQTTIKKKVVKI